MYTYLLLVLTIASFSLHAMDEGGMPMPTLNGRSWAELDEIYRQIEHQKDLKKTACDLERKKRSIQFRNKSEENKEMGKPTARKRLFDDSSEEGE